MREGLPNVSIDYTNIRPAYEMIPPVLNTKMIQENSVQDFIY